MLHPPKATIGRANGAEAWPGKHLPAHRRDLFLDVALLSQSAHVRLPTRNRHLPDMGRFSEALSDLIRLKNSFCHKARRKKTAETFTTLLRLFASVGESRHSLGKSRKIDDNVIGCVRTRIEVVREVEVNRFHTLRFSVL
jgi:hypothetical protein